MFSVAELLSDCSSPRRKSTPGAEIAKESNEITEGSSLLAKPPVIEKENQALVTEVYEFAGDKIT